MDDIERMDGQQVIAVGYYHTIPRPTKGQPSRDFPKDRAALDLPDGTRVYLEPLDSPKSERGVAERHRFDGKRVKVLGTAHRIMPSRAQSLLDPCISDINKIFKDE
jgi:hypothetical protein